VDARVVLGAVDEAVVDRILLFAEGVSGVVRKTCGRQARLT
jgi:hypothetical protein